MRNGDLSRTRTPRTIRFCAATSCTPSIAFSPKTRFSRTATRESRHLTLASSTPPTRPFMPASRRRATDAHGASKPSAKQVQSSGARNSLRRSTRFHSVRPTLKRRKTYSLTATGRSSATSTISFSTTSIAYPRRFLPRSCAEAAMRSKRCRRQLMLMTTRRRKPPTTSCAKPLRITPR